MLAASAAVVEALQLGSGELPDAMLQDLQAVRESATAFDDRTKPVSRSVPDATAKRNQQTAEPRRRQYRLAAPDFVDPALVSNLGQVYSLKSGAAAADSLSWLEDDRLSRVPAKQQIGYVMAGRGFQFRMPREVILTPVRDPLSGEILGALSVGLPLTDYGENIIYDLNRPGKAGAIATGLWLEDHLVTSSIPAADQPARKEKVRAAIRDHGAGQAG